MSREVTVTGIIETSQDGADELDLHLRRTDVSFSNMLHQTVTIATNTTNEQIPFGSGFSSASHGMISVEGVDITYSRNGNAAHHEIADGGFVLWEGDTTSLFLSNNSTDTEADVTITLLGD